MYITLTVEWFLDSSYLYACRVGDNCLFSGLSNFADVKVGAADFNAFFGS